MLTKWLTELYIPRVITGVTATEVSQVFTSEEVVGYLYVTANYSNGDVEQSVRSPDLNVI